MKLVKYLFPAYFRKIGWIALIPLLAWLTWMQVNVNLSRILPGVFLELHLPPDYYDSGSVSFFYALFKSYGNSWLDEFTLLGITLAFIFIAFSREKMEDEYVWKIRMESLVWAFIVDAVLVIAATFLLFKTDFVLFMAMNFYFILILFIVKFRIAMFGAKKSMNHEE